MEKPPARLSVGGFSMFFYFPQGFAPNPCRQMGAGELRLP
jgi:hypothetical protein